MKKHEIRVILPPELKASPVLRWAKEISGIGHADRFVFELGNVTFVEPFGMLLCGAVIRQFKEGRMNGPDPPEFRFRGYHSLSYASHMGFFRSFGLEYGNAPGEAAGNSRYIPITRLEIAALYEDARRESYVIGEAVEAESRRIARVLTQQSSGYLLETLTYSLREILRNAVEHSRGDAIWYSAQYWPTKDRVEIGVLDEGIGIRRGLGANPRHADLDDHNALHWAIQPGVSGVARAEREDRRLETDVWANSGYGLFLTSSICRRGGSFLIASQSKSLSLDHRGASFQDTLFQGTAIQMVLDTSRVRDLTKTLDSIRRWGERRAGKSSYGGNLSASMISRMLSQQKLEEAEAGEDPIAVGSRVRHPSFGPGIVTEIQGVEARRRATVLFDDAGVKTVMMKYAKLVLD